MKFWNFIGGIVRGETAESSKRVIALVMTALFVYLAVSYPKDNQVFVLLSYIGGFIITVLITNAVQDHQGKKLDKDKL